MKLRGIEFGNILGASGVQGFFGEGYWFHRLGMLVGLSFKNVTFVAKTVTLRPNLGNMPLTRHYTPREWFPACVKAQFRQGRMLNAVGLSNPGLRTLLHTGRWQARTSPFWLSVMSLAKTPEKRFDEFKQIVEILAFEKRRFKAPFGLQINLSCPNTSHDPRELIGESARILDVAEILGVPLMPKYSIATAPIEAIRELEDHPSCDAICVSNTLPFNWKGLDWQRVWGTSESPLKHLGGGGLSGSVLRPLVCDWITVLRNRGFTKPINGGGGIMGPDDVTHYNNAEASSIFVGTVAAMRPWRMRSIVARANDLYWRP